MYYIIWAEVGKFFSYLILDVKLDSEVGKIEELESADISYYTNALGLRGMVNGSWKALSLEELGKNFPTSWPLQLLFPTTSMPLIYELCNYSACTNTSVKQVDLNFDFLAR